MKFEIKHAGKWVAAKDDKIVGSAKTLKMLMKKVKGRKGIKFALVPKGYIAG